MSHLFKLAGAIVLLSVMNTAFAESPRAFKRLSPEGLADSQTLWGYSQVIVTDPSVRIVYVSGSTGDDASGNIVHPDDFAKQVVRTFANIETSLKSAGATGEDVVRLRLYVVNFDAEKHWPIIGDAMRKTFGESGPTATMIGVSALAEPSILFEADVTAVIKAM